LKKGRDKLKEKNERVKERNRQTKGRECDRVKERDKEFNRYGGEIRENGNS
jgi:hypothetical protein